MSTYQVGGGNSWGEAGTIDSSGQIYQGINHNWFWGANDSRVAKIDSTTGLPMAPWGDGTGVSASFGYSDVQGAPDQLEADAAGNIVAPTSHVFGAERNAGVQRVSAANGYTTMNFDTDRSAGKDDEANTIAPQPDGKLLFGGKRRIVDDYDSFVARTEHNEIPDYQTGVNDWTNGSAMFGMCMSTRSLGTNANDADTWTTGGCGVGGVGWHGLSSSSAPGLPTKIVECNASCANASLTASFRFGLRASATTPAGVYRAPITFEGYYPNVAY
jgi:hypothetical protein